MISSRTLAFPGLHLAASLLALPWPAAAAENADACADAYELTQSELLSHRLLDARKDARICVATCPPRLADDCSAWETRITSHIPSFVVQARSAEGAPLAVDVQVDGAPAALTETGSIEAEPGPHRLVVRHSGVSVEAHVDLVAGVRNQLVEVTIPDTAAPVLPPSSAAAYRPPPTPFWRWLVGGLGLAPVAAGGAVSISVEVMADQLRGKPPGGCAPNCTPAQAQEVVQRWVIGGTVMGVGAVVFAAAMLWPAPSPAAPRSGRGLAARVALRPGWVGVEVAF